MQRFVRLSEGLKMLGMGRSTYYRQLKTDATLPKIVKPLGEGTKPSALVESEIIEYQTARIAERDLRAA